MIATDAFFNGVREAGEGLLSSLRLNLLEVGAMCDSAGVIPDDFGGNSGLVYAALMEAWRAGEPYDFIRLMSRLRGVQSTSMFRSADAIAIVSNFFGCTATSGLADRYIQTLLEARAARKLHELGSRLQARAFDASTDIVALLEDAQKELSGIGARPDTTHKHISHFAREIVADLEEPEKHKNAEVIEIGLGIDEMAGPFERGDLLVVAGLTKGGKSSLAGNMIEHCAQQGRRCAMFSFEMTGKQNVQRMLVSHTRINIRELRNSLVSDKTLFDDNQAHAMERYRLDRIRQTAQEMEGWKVEIFERLKGIEQVTAEMARMKALGGLDVAMIDYAQLVRGLRSKGESREREVASISYELKQACMRNECLGILLSQLTVDSNGGAHLRESRALGQDANCVLFIEGDGREKQLRVVAARSAPSGSTIDLVWEEEFTKFSAP